MSVLAASNYVTNSTYSDSGREFKFGVPSGLFLHMTTSALPFVSVSNTEMDAKIRHLIRSHFDRQIKAIKDKPIVQDTLICESNELAVPLYLCKLERQNSL